MDLNKVTLIGNLTRDPESKNLPSGQAVVKGGVATNRVFKTKEGEKKEVTVFHNFVAWSKLGEIVMKFLKKGDKVYLEGRIDNRSYQDKTGAKKYISEVVVDNLIMLGGASSKAKTTKQKQAEEAAVEEEEVDLEKIPF